MADRTPHFGRNLRTQIEARGYSVIAFSRVYAAQEHMEPEVARRSLYRWIGNANPPRSETVRKLATALEIGKKDLTGDDDEEDSLAARLMQRAIQAFVDEALQKRVMA